MFAVKDILVHLLDCSKFLLPPWKSLLLSFVPPINFITLKIYTKNGGNQEVEGLLTIMLLDTFLALPRHMSSISLPISSVITQPHNNNPSKNQSYHCPKDSSQAKPSLFIRFATRHQSNTSP